MQAVLASYVATLLGMLSDMLLSYIAQQIDWTSFVKLWVGPQFVLSVVMAVVMACVVGRWSHRRPNPWVWIPFTMILLLAMLTERGSTWDGFFGNNCGGSECIGQVFFAAPCFASIAFSVTALFLQPKPLVESDR
jgi:hypothetical protein